MEISPQSAGTLAQIIATLLVALAFSAAHTPLPDHALRVYRKISRFGGLFCGVLLLALLCISVIKEAPMTFTRSGAIYYCVLAFVFVYELFMSVFLSVLSPVSKTSHQQPRLSGEKPRKERD